MNPIEQELLGSLKELESAIASIATQKTKPDLLPHFSRIEEITARLPKETHPQLRHFLMRKSYEKAREWLETNV
jgi:hypothetical protein